MGAARRGSSATPTSTTTTGCGAARSRGIITPTTKERLLALEAEQEALRRVPGTPPTAAIHPNLARLYREKVRRIEAELADPDINDTADFVLSLSGQASDAAGAERGKAIFAEQCAACHGETGTGSLDQSAPDLTDAIWLSTAAARWRSPRA